MKSPRVRLLLPAVSALALASCGGDDSYSPNNGGRDPTDVIVTPAPSPAPSPTPSPTPVPTPTPTGSTGGGTSSGYSEADFNGGTTYPAEATATVKSVRVPAGATIVNVPVELDHASPNTVVVRVRVANGNGGRANPDTDKAVIFRPGDPLTKTRSFAITGMSEGSTVLTGQPEVPTGAIRADGTSTATAAAGAVNPAVEGGRAAMHFAPVGQLVYSETGDTIKFDDNGGPDSFSTALSHGRTQPGNDETGYYGTTAMNIFSRSGGNLVINSYRPARAITDNGTSYPFLAGMLSGHNTTASYITYGSIEWDVKMPNRFGSWPALWLLPTTGWPPEIDVYEGFGYNNSWSFPGDLSTNLHGGKNNVRTFVRGGGTMTMKDFGLEPTIDSEFHKFAVTVTPQWITMFVDGVETMQYANPFAGTTWYPLMNIAVKAPRSDSYNTGKGTMEIRSLKIWRQQ